MIGEVIEYHLTMKDFTVLITAVLLFLFCRIADGALSTVIDSGEEECFAIRAPPGESSMISGSYDCLDDELEPDPVGVILYDKQMKPVWRSRSGASEGSFQLYGSGKYELCIQNGSLGSDDYFAPKDGNDREIGFSLRVIPQSRGTENNEAGPDNRLVTNLMKMSDQLIAGLDTMTDHQEYMRERENRHTILTDTTFNRVVQWTVLEAIVLVLISCGQVLYLKKFFEQTRYL